MRRIFAALLCVGVLISVQLASTASVWGSSYVPTFANKTGTSTSSDFYATAFGAGVWVKTAGTTPYYSTNGGQDWTAATTNATAGRYENVEFVNGRFFALCVTICSAGKQIQYSDDGMTWVTASVPTTNVPVNDADWNDVAYGNGILVAVGSGAVSGDETANRVLRSTDNGATWQVHTFPQINTFPVTYAAGNAVTYVDGNFIAVGTRTMRSEDGTTWTITNSTFLNDVAYGNGVLLGVLGYAGGTNHLYKSTNSGTSWSAVTHPSLGVSAQTVFRLRYGNGVFLFGATKFVTTVNGSAFSAATNWLATGSGQWRGLGFGQGVFMAVGDTSNGGASKTIASTDTPDSTAPTLSQQSPADGANAVAGNADIVLTFSESVIAGPGYFISIKKVSDNSTIETFDATSNRISIAGSVVTINPSSDLRASTTYYVSIERGAITDNALNPFVGITSSSGYTFTTAADNVAPSAPSTPDLHLSSDLGSSNSDNVTSSTLLTMLTQASENGGTVTITATANGVADKTCTLTGSISSNHCALLGMTAGTWSVTARHEDINGNISPSSAALSVVVDRTAPILQSTSPVRDATGVSVTDNILFNYDEPVYGATGNILVKSGGSTCPTTDQTIVATSASVTSSGNSLVINPPNNFAYAATQCISFSAGVVKDTAGNSAAAHDPTAAGGVRFTTEAADTTAPTATIASPSSPSSSRTMTYVVTFSEQVSGIAASDFNNVGTATCSMTVSVSSGTSVSVTATCSTDGTVMMGLDANSVLDAASNVGPLLAVTASTVVIDTSSSTTSLVSVSPASPTTVVVVTTTTTIPMDGDSQAIVSGDLEISGSSGTTTASDGSTFGVNSKGALSLRLWTGYIGSASGYVQATYKVGRTTKRWKCTIRSVAIDKVNKKAKRSSGGWFPKKFKVVKNSCVLPVQLRTVLKTQKVVLTAQVRFIKKWPTTGKAINPDTGAKIPVGIRKLRIKIGN